MKKIITLLSLAVCLSASSQVLIYKNRITITETGGGFTTSRLMTGYTYLDLADNTFTRVEVYGKDKLFLVKSLDNWRVSIATGPGKEYTAFSQTTERTDNAGHLFSDTEFAKGLNASTDIGVFANPLKAPPKWRIPSSMQFIGRTVYTKSNGTTAIQENSGTLVLDLNQTRSSNFPSRSVASLIAMLRIDLMGYTEIN